MMHSATRSGGGGFLVHPRSSSAMSEPGGSMVSSTCGGTARVTDAAAGMLIFTEAGGLVSDLNGEPLDFPEEVTVGRCIIATNGKLHHKVIEFTLR